MDVEMFAADLAKEIFNEKMLHLRWTRGGETSDISGFIVWPDALGSRKRKTF